MNMASIYMAFLMGLTGSLHCAGMCGPIIWMVPFRQFHKSKQWLALIAYHFSRVSAYAFLGLLLHTFKNLFHPQYQQYLSIGIGSFMLFLGVINFMPAQWHTAIKWPFTNWIQKTLGKFIAQPQLHKVAITGLLNGLLPCGLVYMMLSASMSVIDSREAVMVIYAFGLGTMPMLFAITLLQRRISLFSGTHIKHWVPAAMLVLGGLFVIRGLNLGIPYLSPKSGITATGLKVQCCQKQ